MRILRALVAVVMLVCFASIASAQDSLIGTLSKKDSSVYKVMRTAGCDMRWLSQAISDSRIDPARVRRLPVGQKIYLKGNVCKSNPSVQVAKASNDILKSDRPQPKVVQAETALVQNPSNQAEVSKIREESATVTKQFANATAEIAKHLAELKTAKETIEVLKRENGESRGKLSAGSTLSWQIVTGFLFMALLVVSYRVRKLGLAVTKFEFAAMASAKNTQFKPEVVVEHWAKENVFPLRMKPDTREIGYECPVCHELLFQAYNCEGHMRNCHPTKGQFTWEEELA